MLKKNSLVIPNGIPQSIRIYMNTSKKAYDFIYAGRLAQIKRVELILKAAKILKDLNYDFKIAIIGEGEQSDYLKKLSEIFDVNDKIDFLGYVEEDLKYRHVSRSRFLVLPSLWEGDPLVIKEALSLGVPCIVSDIDALKERIVDGFNGFIFKRDNIRDLVLMMRRALMIDEASYRRLSENAKASVSGCTWTNVARVYHKLISSLLNAKQKAKYA